MSKTDHPRIPGTHRVGHVVAGHCPGCSYCKGGRPRNPFLQDVQEGLVAYLDETMPAKASRIESVERAHAQALEINALEAWERVLLGHQTQQYPLNAYDDDFPVPTQAEIDESWNEWAEEQANAAWLEEDEEGFEQDDDHWLPYARNMAEVRDIFGGTDFIITHAFRA